MSGYVTHPPAYGLTRPARRQRRPLVAVGRWALLLVALTGLFAMHGLSDHGGAASLSYAAAGQQPGHGTSVEEARDSGPMAAATHASASGASESHDGGHSGHDALLVGACVAILAAVLLWGRAAAWVRTLRAVRAPLLDLTRALATSIRARARGPARPDLRLLSVQRC